MLLEGLIPVPGTTRIFPLPSLSPAPTDSPTIIGLAPEIPTVTRPGPSTHLSPPAPVGPAASLFPPTSVAVITLPAESRVRNQRIRPGVA